MSYETPDDASFKNRGFSSPAGRISELEDLLKFAQQELHSAHDHWLAEKRHRESVEQDYASLLNLITDIRWACGDEGKRMQDELVTYIGELKQESDLCRTYAAEALEDIQEWAGYAPDVAREVAGLDADLVKWKARAAK